MPQVIHATFAGEDEAAAAISRLVALGVDREAVQRFGATGPGHLGSFADSGEHAHTPERDHLGSFADSGEHAHTPERDHLGSFADVDGSSVQRRTFIDALVAAGLTGAEAEAAAAAIESGGVLVVARAEPGQVEAAALALQHPL